MAVVTERSTRERPPARRWPVERGEAVPSRTTRRSEFAGVASVLAMALAYLSPALVDGPSFGTYDLVLRATSLGRSAYPNTPFNHVASDSVSEMAAWNQFDWSQLHSGHFPLWNPLSLYGLPQFLNFQSGVLSLPNLVSYAVPLHLAYTVSVGLVLVLAGTGAYFLARVLGLRPLGASFAGVAFMLSGPFANWIWDPISSVVSLLGWILAFAILCYRGRHRVASVFGLALSTAFCLYGGFPEAVVFVVAAICVLAVTFTIAAAVRSALGRSGAERGVSWTGLARLLGGGAAGVLLALPLWWPGLQILSIAHRETRTGFDVFHVPMLALFVAQGFDGLQMGKNPWFLQGFNYYESVSYVGIVVLVLAVVACARWWRHPTVIALAVLPLAVLLVLFSHGPFSFLHQFLGFVSSQTYWTRFRIVIGLPLGLLAGLGLETLARRWRETSPLVTFTLATLALAVAVAALWRSPAPAGDALVRERSLYWPSGLVGGCALIALIAFAARHRAGNRRAHGGRRREIGGPVMALCAASLWCGSAAFLLFAGVGTNGYSSAFYPTTPAIAALSADVGSHLVALDGGNGESVSDLVDAGVYPEANLPYGIAEFAGHDPALPQSYFVAFAGGARGGPGFLEPDVETAAEARRLGIAYVIAAPGRPPLPGGVRVAVLAGETLYKVPGAARFTISDGRVSHVSEQENGYDLVVRAEKAAVVTARVTAVPGWSATLDGRALPLRPDGLFYRVDLPPGTHRLRLSYRPARLGEGLAAAGAGAAGLLLYALVSAVLRRRPGERRRAHEGRDPFSFADLSEEAR